MIKILLVTTVAVVGTASIAFAAPNRTTHNMMIMKKSKKVIAANGRCGGVSYGTGARRCNSMSGGPSGGLSSKN